jgi:hypothetical protein
MHRAVWGTPVAGTRVTTIAVVVFLDAVVGYGAGAGRRIGHGRVDRVPVASICPRGVLD